MKKIILNKQQLKETFVQIYKEEQLNILEEKWNRLSESDKKFVIGFLKLTNPKKSHMINEAWYNTIGDIVGIFDPTGVVDLVNGISYFSQGDTLFGIMSLISAVPYIGDVVGKPVILGLKAGGDVAKAMKMAKTGSQWAKLGTKYPIIGKLLLKIEQIGPKLLSMLEKVPGGKRLVNVVRKWVGDTGLLTTAAKEYKYTNAAGKKITANLVTDLEKVSLLKTLKDSLKLGTGGSRAFREYGKDSWGILTKLFKKIGWWKNPKLSILLSKTKFWLGFLDFMGVANFVGPEELVSQVGEKEMEDKMNEYTQTKEGKEKWDEEMKNVNDEEPSGEDKSNLVKDVVKKEFGLDPISILGAMFKA